jgi:hypothetical protein
MIFRFVATFFVYFIVLINIYSQNLNFNYYFKTIFNFNINTNNLDFVINSKNIFNYTSFLYDELDVHRRIKNRRIYNQIFIKDRRKNFSDRRKNFHSLLINL